MSSAKSLSQKVKGNVKKEDLAGLRNWNLIVGSLYVLQAVLILIMGVGRSVAIYTNFLNLDTLQTQAQGRSVFAASMHQIFSINLMYFLITILLLSAIVHFLAATKLKSTYDHNLEQGENKMRWFDHGLVVGLALTLIGLLVGVSDFSLLVSIFFVSCIAAYFGCSIEARFHEDRKISRLMFGMQTFLTFIPWIIFGVYLSSGHLYGQFPTYVGWLVISLFIVFVAYTVNAYLRFYSRTKFAILIQNERTYFVIGFIFKSLLVWQLFAGSLRP